MIRVLHLTCFVLAAALVVACAPPVLPRAVPATPPSATPSIRSTPTAAPVVSPSPIAGDTGVSTLATLSAQKIAAESLGVAPGEVKVLAITPMEWSDASLGCPDPDMMYAQVITPGYQAQVEVDGQTHDIHMDDKGHGIVCTQPQ